MFFVFPAAVGTRPNHLLREHFSSCTPEWTSDPILGGNDRDETIAFKYHGYCGTNANVRGELQVVPMLIGLFWEVEHSAIYKPSPKTQRYRAGA